MVLPLESHHEYQKTIFRGFFQVLGDVHRALKSNSVLDISFVDFSAFVHRGVVQKNRLRPICQELMEPQHFGQCLGFTGTQNDLLYKPMAESSFRLHKATGETKLRFVCFSP